MKVLVILAVAGVVFSFPGEPGSEVSLKWRPSKTLQDKGKGLLYAFKSIQNEEQCLMQGGVCGLESFCPADSRMAPGLCPNQQANGVECCQTIPTNIKSCGGRGGECVEPQRCGKAPTEPNAQCPGDQVCCIFVN